MPEQAMPDTEVHVHGELIGVCREDEETCTVVDLRALSDMTIEERHIRALPVSMQRFMAVCVLAGYRFECVGYTNANGYIWRARHPNGSPILDEYSVHFTGLMFVLDRIGFNDWLRIQTQQEIQLREIT